MTSNCATSSTIRATFWDRYAAVGYDTLRELAPYEALQDAVIAAAAPQAGERLLVAGCGTGNLEVLALRDLPALSIDAIDFSPAMLERARAKCAGYPNVRHLQADLCARLPLPDMSCDVAVMCNVLYALVDGPAALREIFRVLRPGGRFILCDRQPWSTIAPVVKAHYAALRALPPEQRYERWTRTLLTLPRLGLVALANLSLQKSYRRGDCRFYATEAITDILRAIGFTISDPQSVYADQCWLLRAERPCMGYDP